MSLRATQTAALVRMLRFNTEQEGETVWKVLVFDKAGRDIISSVLRMSDLFSNGVTLHLLLDADRAPLSDVPAIYFVEPTAANVQRIGQDIASNLYQSWSLNFTRPLSRSLLEDLAGKTLHTSARVNQVWDQYLQFAVLENDIYSLELPQVYRQLGDPRAAENEIEAVVGSIVDGLFCMLLTQDSIPIIRASRGNAAEMVAQALDERLRSYLANQRQRLPDSKRPVLVLVDRNVDLVSMFSHSWTYQSLITDACEFRRNSVKVGDKLYDLDPKDEFWEKNKRLPFPEVADNLDAALTQYKQDAQRLTGNADPDLENGAQHLRSALTVLPELTARKACIDMHMNISTVLLKAIGDRGLAQLFEAEETAQRQTPRAIKDLITNKEFTNSEDKLRLYLLYFVVSSKLSTADQQDLEAALSEQGCDLTSLRYVRRTKEISKMNMVTQNATVPSKTQDAALFHRVTGITSRLTERLNQGASLTEGFGSLVSGVRSFLPEGRTSLPLTRIVENLLEPNNGSGVTDDYLYFDPRESRGSLTKPPKRTSHDECFVCMIGGGNFYEYANVAEWVANQPGKSVVYGATDIGSPSDFVKQCHDLGKAV